MNYLFASIAGIIQGVTEFLPVSSSGHLLLFHQLTGFRVGNDLAFDAVLHLATFFSLVFYFWRDIILLVVAWCKSFRAEYRRQQREWRLPWLILLAIIPAGAVGYFFEDFIEHNLRGVTIVASMLIAVGMLLWLADRLGERKKTLDNLRLSDALWVGIAQVLSFLPGVSRSGITIIASLTRGLQRTAAARFSFLLALPLTGAAGLKKAIDLIGTTGAEELMLLIGFISAAVSGYLCIRFFLDYLGRATLRGFAYYRIALGVILLLLAWTGVSPL